MSYGDQTEKGRSSLFLLGFVLVALAAVFLSRTSVNFVAKEATTMASNRDHLSDQLRKFQRDMHMLKRELSAVDMLMEGQAIAEQQGSAAEATRQLKLNELNALQTRIHELSRKSMDMKDRVKAVSKQHILEKYGGGVKQVEMELVFPDGKDGPTKFVIALEDNLMPHSSFIFLEMVSSGLLDGCSFILNALHVLKAAPLPYDGSSAAAKAKAFTESGLESVAFKEYSTAMPHIKNTIGFAADGSPSFFINTEDNSEIHAGDPCFGKIIEGLDTVKRLEASPTRNGIWFAKRIGIKRARVL
jgi:cyclophilin family peptidyl-prolyl cis-trans isomerase